jgi:tetratricopeptide (TPR) repeat protein
MKERVSITALVALLTSSVLFWSALGPVPSASAQTRRAVKSARPGGQRRPAEQRAGRELEQAEPVGVLPGRAKRWALIIGVDQYEDNGIGGLYGASNDATSLRNALVAYAGFPEDQVILLASEQPQFYQPRRTNILRSLSLLRRSVPRDGLLLVAFAGHGIERSGRAYLLPADAILEGDIQMLEDTAVNVEKMKSDIRATGVRQVIFFIDACRNDPEPGRGVGGNPLTPSFARSFDFDLRNREVNAFVIFYATSVGQRAYEDKVKKQGYFTWAIVDGLSGKAANERGEVTLASLVEYVQETVPKYVHRDLGAYKRQLPYMDSGGYKVNQLVLAASHRPPAPGGGPTQAASAPGTTPAEPSATNGGSAAAPDQSPLLTKAAGSSAESAGEARTQFLAARGSDGLGDYTAAETGYRKAVSLAPEKALYHHALGMFLQVKQARAAAAQYDALTQQGDYLEMRRVDDYQAQRQEEWNRQTEADCYRGRAERNQRRQDEADMNRRAGRITPLPPQPTAEPPCSTYVWKPPASREGPPVFHVPERTPSPTVSESSAPGLGPSLTLGDEDTKFSSFFKNQVASDEYLSELAEAVRLEPENALYRFDYGSALASQSSILESYDAKAEEEFRAAVRLDPGNAEYHAKLGSVLGGQNKWAEAVVAYGDAVRLDPNNKEYKSALKNAQRMAKK